MPKGSRMSWKSNAERPDPEQYQVLRGDDTGNGGAVQRKIVSRKRLGDVCGVRRRQPAFCRTQIRLGHRPGRPSTARLPGASNTSRILTIRNGAPLKLLCARGGLFSLGVFGHVFNAGGNDRQALVAEFRPVWSAKRANDSWYTQPV